MLCSFSCLNAFFLLQPPVLLSFSLSCSRKPLWSALGLPAPSQTSPAPQRVSEAIFMLRVISLQFFPFSGQCRAGPEEMSQVVGYMQLTQLMLSILGTVSHRDNLQTLSPELHKYHLDIICCSLAPKNKEASG